MSGKPWQEQLLQMVAALPLRKRPPQVAVVGVGQELRGDDAAGLALAWLLNERSGEHSLIVIEAGPAPENCCGLLFRYRPDLILFVDAANMKAESGTVHWLEWADVARAGISTHALPLYIVANYLTAELGCPVALIGIQPANINMGASLTPVIQTAVSETARSLMDLFPVLEGIASE